MTPYILYFNNDKTMGICEVSKTKMGDVDYDLTEKGYVITGIYCRNQEDVYIEFKTKIKGEQK